MMKTTRKQVGDWGEAIAVQHLEANAYVILARNWRHGRGELDIIAQKGNAVVFVEVRTRRNNAFGTPEESITPRKRAKLIETAQAYIRDHDMEDTQWQMDVIVIELDGNNMLARLEHFENAIEGLSC